MNYNKLKRKFAYINETLEDAKKYLKEYQESEDKKDRLALEREIEKIVEISIKINKEILKSKKKFSSTYKNSFLDLEVLNIFEKKFLEELSETAVFRNELAHEYMTMSSFYSIENIKNILNKYPKYILKLIEFIEKEENSKK